MSRVASARGKTFVDRELMEQRIDRIDLDPLDLEGFETAVSFNEPSDADRMACSKSLDGMVWGVTITKENEKARVVIDMEANDQMLTVGIHYGEFSIQEQVPQPEQIGEYVSEHVKTQSEMFADAMDALNRLRSNSETCNVPKGFVLSYPEGKEDKWDFDTEPDDSLIEPGELTFTVTCNAE